MRSFMKHRRGSSGETNNSQRPQLTISPSKVVSDYPSTTLQSTSTESGGNISPDGKNISPISGKTSRIKNFLKQKVSSTNLNLSAAPELKSSSYSPTATSPATLSAPFNNSLSSSSNGLIATHSSPKLKQKSSFSSLSNLGLSSKKHSKSSIQSSLNPNNTWHDLNSYPNYLQSKDNTSSPTIFGTKTHNWSSDEGPRALRQNADIAVSKTSLTGINEESIHLEPYSSIEDSDSVTLSLERISSHELFINKTRSSLSGHNNSTIRRLSGIVSETDILLKKKEVPQDNEDKNEGDDFSIKIVTSEKNGKSSTLKKASKSRRNGRVLQGIETGDMESRPESDNDSLNSHASSEFSFVTNNRAGRNASIKYYKSKDQMNEEENEMINAGLHKKFIEETGAEDFELQDDMNYVDFDAHDDTEDLFNRKLFSSDEEDGADDLSESPNAGDFDFSPKSQTSRNDPESTNYGNLDNMNDNAEDADADYDRYLDEINYETSSSDSVSINEEDIEKEESLSKEGKSSMDSNVADVSTSSTVFEDNSLSKDEKGEGRSETTTAGKEPSDDIVKLLKKLSTSPGADTVAKLTNSSTSNSSSVTPSESFKTIPLRKSIIKPNFVNRKSSVKYHQVDGAIDDDLEFLEKRYSWFPDADEGSKTCNIDSHSNSISSMNVSNLDEINESGENYTGFDESLLDEVNQLPEDYEFDESNDAINAAYNSVHSNGSIRSRQSLRSLKSASSQRTVLRTPSCGNRIEMTDKTITLFKPISRNSSIRSNQSDNNVGANTGLNARLSNSISSHRQHPYETLSHRTKQGKGSSREQDTNTVTKDSTISSDIKRINSAGKGDLLLTTINEVIN